MLVPQGEEQDSFPTQPRVSMGQRASRSDARRGYMVALAHSLHKDVAAAAQTNSGEQEGLFKGFNPWCYLLKLDDPDLRFSNILNQTETTAALPPHPQEDLMPGIPYMCHSIQCTSLHCVPSHPDPCTDPAPLSAGCPFPQRNRDLSLSRALSNLHKIMQTRCFFFLASPACSV